MHHGTHEAALDLRLVPGLGAQIVLSIDNELRRARFRNRRGRQQTIDQRHHRGVLLKGTALIRALSYYVGLTLPRAAPSGISPNCFALRKASSPTD
jgi:hypothetical protein